MAGVLKGQLGDGKDNGNRVYGLSTFCRLMCLMGELAEWKSKRKQGLRFMAPDFSADLCSFFVPWDVSDWESYRKV